MSISRPPSYEEAVQGNGQRSSHSNNIPGGPVRNVSVSSRDSRVDADMHKEEKNQVSLRRASISSVDSVEDRQRDLLQHDRAASLAISRPPQLERWEDNPLRVEDVGYDPLFSPVEGKQQAEKRDSGQGRPQAISVAYISFGPSPVAVDLHEGIMDDRQKRPSIIYRMHAARVNEYEEQQLSSFPAFTLLVVIIDIVLFIITMGENNWSFEAYSVNPMFGPSSATEIKMGAKLTSRILGGDWYRLIAPMFLHAGLIHLLLNMMVMWRMAKDFEESFGTIRISIIFLASGVFGTLLSAIFVPDMIGVGASGALYGLLGASWGDLFHNWHYITHGRNWYIIRLTISSIGGLVIGLLPYIDNFAHIGGWVCGVVAGSAIMIGSMRDPIDGRRRYKNKLLFIISTALCVAMFIIAISVLYGRADVNKWCSWCHYLDCVDTRWWDCSQQYAQACTMYNGTIVECHPL